MVDMVMKVGDVFLTHRLFTEASYATLPWDSCFVRSQLGRKHTGPVGRKAAPYSASISVYISGHVTHGWPSGPSDKLA